MKKILFYFLLVGIIAVVFSGCAKNEVSPYEGKWGYIKESNSGHSDYHGLKVCFDMIEIRKAKVEERNKKDRDEFVVKFGDASYFRVKGYPKKNNDGVVEVVYKWALAPTYNDKIIGVIDPQSTDQESTMHLIRSFYVGENKLFYFKKRDYIEYVSEARLKHGMPNLIYRRLVDAEVADIKEVIRNDVKNSKYIASLKKSCKAKGEVLDIKFID